ncbi:MAG: hypothetical protein K9G46_15505, partial [Flavobacteriales bacterium]|nr:hypothetical protein [Flavobacteriales bacterium]
MPNFRIGITHLIHDDTRYFLKGAGSLSSGEIGEKGPHHGSVNIHMKLDVAGLALMNGSILEFVSIHYNKEKWENLRSKRQPSAKLRDPRPSSFTYFQDQIFLAANAQNKRDRLRYFGAALHVLED